jgi:hypothetical protein
VEHHLRPHICRLHRQGRTSRGRDKQAEEGYGKRMAKTVAMKVRAARPVHDGSGASSAAQPPSQRDPP